MAKDQSYYFSHDVDAFNDPKIVAMISEYGVIAYAWWWIIIEKLASYEDYKLPLKKYTFVALDNELGMKNEQNSTCVEHVFNKNEHVLEQNTFCSFCSFLFINALINDFELLACDDEFFWSPSLTRRFELRKTKNEEISQKRRLAGLKSGEARRKNEQKRTSVEQNELIKEKKRKENIYSYSYYSDAENKKSDELLHMFDDEPPKTDPYKNVFKIYMNDVGEISPMTKEKLEYLVNDFGESEVITAISKSVEVGKASIAYITAILNNKIREEAAKESGTNRRGKGNRTNKAKSDGSDVDWKNETGEWL